MNSENTAIFLAHTNNVALIVRANNAMTLLEDEQRVEMDPEKGLVYQEVTLPPSYYHI